MTTQYNKINTNTQDKAMENITDERQEDTHAVIKLLGWLVIFITSFVWNTPYALAAKEHWGSWENYGYNQLKKINPLGAELQAIRQHAKLALSDKEKQELAVGTILAKRETVLELDKQMRQQMQQAEQHIKANKLHSDIAKRQQEQTQHYTKNMNQTLKLLKQLQQQQQPSWWNKLLSQLPVLKNHLSTDPQDTLQALAQQLNQPFSGPAQSYSNELDFIDPPVRIIYTNQTEIDDLIGTDSGDYTSTDSATNITQAITDKVAEVGSDPLALYNYVYNTIQWLPSYGVMQGADYTLQAGQGNAFDTSSLLISLLRAAGHEARYRYGTVTMPLDKVQNWVGDVVNADAAGNLLSQGGIPTLQVNSGGATERMRIEHVWVQVNVGGVWQDLDPSYKQYTYNQAVDVESAVPFDTQSLIDGLQAGSSDDVEGWVQGIDINILQNRLEQYKQDVTAYIDTNLPTATLADIVGSKEIISSIISDYSSALPDYSIQYSAVTANLPDALFHRFQYQVADTVTFDLGTSFEWNTELLTFNRRTAELVGKDIAISFRPATQADEDALFSFIPDDATNLEDVPDALPAGIINMIGEVTLDGMVEQITPTVTLGQLLKTRIGFIAPQESWNFRENDLDVGTYRAIGIDMQGISSKTVASFTSSS